MKRFLWMVLVLLFSVVWTQAQDEHLRTIEFDIDESDIVEVELTIEEDDVSVLFQVVASDPDAPLGLLEIFTPDDELLYLLDDMNNEIEFGFVPYTEENTGELGVFLPAAPQYDLEAGDYIFAFGTEFDDIESVTAIVRSGNVDVRQAIDINLGVFSWDSELDDPRQQDDFEEALRQHVDALLNPHNLQLGAVNYIFPDEDMVDELGYPEITDDDVSILNEICAEMNALVGFSNALNVVLLDGFDEGDSEAGGTAGVSMGAGNTGIINSDESPHSCVVVSWEAYADDMSSQAANIIHESAHFMSIPHTTEAGGFAFDIFEDTAECDADEFDEDGDGLVDDFECGVLGGADNFMFWNGDPEAGLTPYTMSADQAWVMRRHPLFYPVSN